MEHRWGQRRRVQVPVELRLGTRRLGTGWTDNLSLSGAFVRIPACMPLWARVEVELLAAHSRGPSRPVIHAQVVRVAEDGVGVEWAEYAPDPIGILLAAPTTSPQRPRMEAPPEASTDSS
jgi:PilZ domain